MTIILPRHNYKEVSVRDSYRLTHDPVSHKKPYYESCRGNNLYSIYDIPSCP